nr:30S ribosomal protein S3 [Ruminococcus sp.]
MGQKVNPHGLRVGVIKDWDSRWYANKADFGDTLVEDYNVRNFIKKSLYAAGVPRIEIERFADKVRIHIHCAKPGIVIGRQGAEIEKLRAQLEAMMKKQVFVNIIEVKQPDMDSQLVAEKIALDLENRVSFRRAMKQSIGRTMRLGAKGIKVKVSGRLAGAEIARSESYHEGTIPLQ